MTPRQRVMAALNGEKVDKVPFTVYEQKIPQCAAERELRNRGACIVRRAGVCSVHRPNVKTTQTITFEGGKRMVRTTHETPVGTLTELVEPAGFTSWHREYMFKGPDDYKAMRFLFADEQLEANYAPFAKAQADLGEDFVCRAYMGQLPLLHLMTGHMMSMQDFCMEWMDRRDEILAIYDVLAANQRKTCALVAGSPAAFANCGGNVVPEVTSPADFREYFLPHIQEAAGVLHARGKKIGCHLDANCGPHAELIAESDLDYIEAFTPAPDTDMTLAEARAAWPDKVLWLNYPSSMHLKGDAEVAEGAFELLDSLDSVDGVIMGITEDVPQDRWRDSFRAIMDGLDRHAAERPELYAR
jgi:hypothetical protein